MANIIGAGAHRRQLALKGEQPLNLPDNSLLDGLFTSGLRFVSSWAGLGGGRVATARYEMLHLTEEAHQLGPPLSGPGVREFLVPTQLTQAATVFIDGVTLHLREAIKFSG